MPSPKKSIPEATVALPLGEGRVEVTVVGDEIWLSDYASPTRRNFTLVIERGKLAGNECACQSVHEIIKDQLSRSAGRPARTNGSKSGAGKPNGSRRVAAAHRSLAKKPPKMAGYWYQDPNSSAHGGPVVVVEP